MTMTKNLSTHGKIPYCYPGIPGVGKRESNFEKYIKKELEQQGYEVIQQQTIKSPFFLIKVDLIAKQQDSEKIIEVKWFQSDAELVRSMAQSLWYEFTLQKNAYLALWCYVFATSSPLLHQFLKKYQTKVLIVTPKALQFFETIPERLALCNQCPLREKWIDAELKNGVWIPIRKKKNKKGKK